MITSSDSFTTYDLGKYYVILPQASNWNLNEYITHFDAVKVPEGFSYNSGTNTDWLSVDDLRNLIRQHVDPAFLPTNNYELNTIR